MALLQFNFKRLDSYIKHDRDYNFTYAGLRQVSDKYLVQDRSSGNVFETPQYMYMLIAATLFCNYPKETRLSYVKRYYDEDVFKIFALHDINEGDELTHTYQSLQWRKCFKNLKFVTSSFINLKLSCEHKCNNDVCSYIKLSNTCTV